MVSSGKGRPFGDSFLPLIEMFQDMLDQQPFIDEADDLHLATYLWHSRGSTSQTFLMHSRQLLDGIFFCLGSNALGRRRHRQPRASIHKW